MMDWAELTLSVVQSEPFQMLLAGIVGYILVKVFKAGEWWEKYKGPISTAIDLAEKAVPEDTSNPGLQRLDWALDYSLDIIEKTEGRTLKEKEVTELKSAVQRVFATRRSAGDI